MRGFKSLQNVRGENDDVDNIFCSSVVKCDDGTWDFTITVFGESIVLKS